MASQTLDLSIASTLRTRAAQTSTFDALETAFGNQYSDYTIREVVTKQYGSHEIRFGGEAVRLRNHITNTYQMSGSFTFSVQLSGEAVADFMMGRASSFS